MKKKLILLLVFSINIIYICFAQQTETERNRTGELQKVYITKEVSLTNEESEKFWPVFRNYKAELRTTRRQKNTSDPIEVEEVVLSVKKKYRPEFKKILGSDERVNKVFIADKSFNEMLRRELLQRQKQQK